MLQEMKEEIAVKVEKAILGFGRTFFHDENKEAMQLSANGGKAILCVKINDKWDKKEV